MMSSKGLAMYDRREVFTDAPLALVTAQVTLSYEPRVNDIAVRDAFAQVVRARLPLFSIESLEAFRVELPSGQSSQESLPQMRAVNTQRTMSVALNANSVTVDAVEYEHFEGFKDLLRYCFEALTSTVPDAYVTRVGLRYIDEIRAPGLEQTRDWSGWIADDLLASFNVLQDQTIAGLNGQMVFQIDEVTNLLLRWGEMQGISVIAPNHPLRRPTIAPGRFFVLDADAFWQPTDAKRFDTDSLIECLDRLHKPVGEIFQASLTDKARGLFRGKTHG